MICLLCLESIDNFMDCIQVNSKTWNKQNIKYIIEKHLWPMNTIQLYSSVCSNCAQALFSFHTFYKRIEKAHRNMSIMVETENEKFVEDINTNHFSDTTQDNEEELVPKIMYSDNFNDSSLDIKDNEAYMESSSEPEMLQEQLIFEKVNVTRIEDEKNQRIDECFLKSGAAKGTPEENEDSHEKSKKELKDTDSITVTLRQQTNKSFFQEKKNLSAKEDNSNLISSDDQEVEKANTAQHTKSDFSIIKIDTSNRKEATKEYDRIISEHFKIKCNLCHISLENFIKLHEHFEVEHKQCGYVRCCNRTFYSRVSLVDHIYGHMKPDYLKCKVCDKVFATRYNLIAHSRRHDESQLLKCDKCDKSFTTPSILKRHTESVHQNKFVQICEVCGKSLRCPNSFEQHMKNHEDVIEHVSCDICGKLYVNIKGLKRHKRYQHPEGGKKYHKCDVCGQFLFSALSLKRHKLSQHPEGGKKEHTCHICSKVSPNPIALKEHIKDIHERGYNYKCTMCDRAFTKPRYLKEHLARHTGTALYSCTWCPKTFTTSGNKYLHNKKTHPVEWQEHLQKINAKKYNP